MADTAPVDALRQTDEPAPLSDTELGEIRARNTYLRTVPFETHGPGVHSDGCPPCGMVRSISDVTRLLAALDDARKQSAEIGEAREEFALRTDDGREAFCATGDGAMRIAEDWNRVRSDGPWSAERRYVGQWHKVKPEADRG
jgi:hypothetical protein